MVSWCMGFDLIIWAEKLEVILFQESQNLGWFSAEQLLCFKTTHFFFEVFLSLSASQAFNHVGVAKLQSLWGQVAVAMRWTLLRRSEFQFLHTRESGEGEPQKRLVGWTFPLPFENTLSGRNSEDYVVLFTQVKMINKNTWLTIQVPIITRRIEPHPNVWQYWCFSLGIFPFLGWFKVTILGSFKVIPKTSNMRASIHEFWCIFLKTLSSNLFNNLGSGTWIPSRWVSLKHWHYVR